MAIGAEALRQALGTDKLSAPVNSAAVAVAGPFLEFSVAEFRR
jgi:hypothetical protein